MIHALHKAKCLILKHIQIFKFFHLQIVLTLVFFLSSCKDQRTFLPKVSGSSGEVLVVMPDALWKSNIGLELGKVLYTTYEGLPQEEPMFDIIQINETALRNLFKQYRNIIIVRIGDQYKRKEILVQKNLWADTQIILTMLAPSDTAFHNLLNEKKIQILAAISDAERKRLLKIYKSISDRKINEELINKHKLKLAIPNSFRLDVDSSDFIWYSCEHQDITQGIFIYHYENNNSNSFTKEYLIDKRNQFLKKYVAGEIKGSFMTTESLYPPLFNQYSLNNTPTYELRGLWRIQDGLAMGGPFINITQCDAKLNRVVTVEGFVFAPAHKKRELLRQVEAIVLSLEIN